MKSFGGPVALVTDAASVEFALALRPVLELSRLRVDYYRIVQEPHLPDFLAGVCRRYDYTVLCAHGTTGDDGEPKIVVETVDQVDGDYEAETGWEPAMIELTRRNVPELVHADGGTLVATGCGAGRQALARAFLDAGFGAYVGMSEPYADAESALLFMVGFFYFALAEDRAPVRCPTPTPRRSSMPPPWTRRFRTAPDHSAIGPGEIEAASGEDVVVQEWPWTTTARPVERRRTCRRPDTCWCESRFGRHTRWWWPDDRPPPVGITHPRFGLS